MSQVFTIQQIPSSPNNTFRERSQKLYQSRFTISSSSRAFNTESSGQTSFTKYFRCHEADFHARPGFLYDVHGKKSANTFPGSSISQLSPWCFESEKPRAVTSTNIWHPRTQISLGSSEPNRSTGSTIFFLGHFSTRHSTPISVNP